MIFKRKIKFVNLSELNKKVSVNSINKSLKAQAIKEKFIEPVVPKQKFWITGE